jgi:hypothetical protein
VFLEGVDNTQANQYIHGALGFHGINIEIIRDDTEVDILGD